MADSSYNSDFISRRTFLDKALKKLFRRLIEFPDLEFLFRIPEIILKESSHCALISIANPHVIHWGCAKAKKKNIREISKKWIADSGDPYYNNGNSEKFKAKFKKWNIFFAQIQILLVYQCRLQLKAMIKNMRKKLK